MTAEIARACWFVGTRVPGPMVVTGHSAGGHLSARMGCADISVPVARVVPISPLAELGPLILIVQPRPYRGGAGALARFQAALGEAVLPPTISPRLPVQAALSLPTGKKAPVAP